MLLIIFGPNGKRLAGPEQRPNFTDDLILDFLRRHPTGDVELFDDGEVPDGIPPEAMLLVDGQVVADPAYQPPAPAPDLLAELAAKVERAGQAVENNVLASPHDKRGLKDKTLGKTIIPWIKDHPACTIEEALAQVIRGVWEELPDEPIIPGLWTEVPHPDLPGVTVYMGLGPSYLHEAIKRGYCPPETPMTWEALVGLIVATPPGQIAAWLDSL